MRLRRLSLLALVLPAAVACSRRIASTPSDPSAAPPAPAAPTSEPAARATDVVVLLDTSGSMNAAAATGTRVTRLTWAKEAAAAWIAGRKAGAVGVVLFGEKAIVVAPLTRDYTEACRRIQDARIAAAGGTETAFGEALVAGARTFTDPSHDRALLLLTDGEHQWPGADDPLGATRFVKDQGVRIHVVQIGDEEEAEVHAGEDMFNEPVYTRIRFPRDRTLLQFFATETGGRYAVAKNEGELGAALLSVAR